MYLENKFCMNVYPYASIRLYAFMQTLPRQLLHLLLLLLFLIILPQSLLVSSNTSTSTSSGYSACLLLSQLPLVSMILILQGALKSFFQSLFVIFCSKLSIFIFYFFSQRNYSLQHLKMGTSAYVIAPHTTKQQNLEVTEVF